MLWFATKEMWCRVEMWNGGLYFGEQLKIKVEVKFS